MARDEAQAREEMINHDQWVTRVVPKITAALPKTRAEDDAKGRPHDRVNNLVTFTHGIIAEAEKSGRTQHWSYETIVVRLCAALYQLAEMQDALKMPLEGNRRIGGL